MDAKSLRKYDNWIGKSALDIRHDIINAGGWTKVFDEGKLDKWVHRLRNFFNEPPRDIYRVEEREAWKVIRGARKARSGVVNSLATDLAPSGEVYKARYLNSAGKLEWRYWIEQSQLGSMYHSKEQFGPVRSAVTPRSMTGNFKLCSGDGTGGSSEWCVHNWMHGWTGRFGKGSMTKKGGLVNAYTQGITTAKYRGSYNFADTMLRGYDQHVRLDVDPDENYGAKYELTGISSKGIEWLPLKDRIFKKEFAFD